MSVEEPGQSGAVAASALDGPHSPTWLPLGQAKQLLVARWGGRHRRLVDGGAGGGSDDRGGVVSTPMTTSTSSARMAMR